jgi:hypothetical protein
MASTRELSAAPASVSVALSAGGNLSAAAVHYEVVRIARGNAAFGEPFADVHVHRDGPRHRFVAGYLGLEWAPGRAELAVTSHGRQVASITSRDDGSLVIDRTPEPEWPDAGFAVVASRFGAVHGGAAGREVVTGNDLAFYLVHGPAAEKVAARIDDLRVRAALFGHPIPLERG